MFSKNMTNNMTKVKEAEITISGSVDVFVMFFVSGWKTNARVHSRADLFAPVSYTKLCELCRIHPRQLDMKTY